MSIVNVVVSMAEKGEKKVVLLVVARIVVITAVVFSLLYLGYYLYLDFRWNRRSGQLVACCSSLMNIGTALEMYSSDNGGHYPLQLTGLTPGYLKTLPTCPAANSDSCYSQSYHCATIPDAFTVRCSGHFHSSDTVADYPLFTSTDGLVVKPDNACWSLYERWGYSHKPRWLWKILHP